jgi:hypothetical protein
MTYSIRFNIPADSTLEQEYKNHKELERFTVYLPDNLPNEHQVVDWLKRAEESRNVEAYQFLVTEYADYPEENGSFEIYDQCNGQSFIDNYNESITGN